MFHETGEHNHRSSGGFVKDVKLVVASELKFASFVIFRV